MIFYKLFEFEKIMQINNFFSYSLSTNQPLSIVIHVCNIFNCQIFSLELKNQLKNCIFEQNQSLCNRNIQKLIVGQTDVVCTQICVSPIYFSNKNRINVILKKTNFKRIYLLYRRKV